MIFNLLALYLDTFLMKIEFIGHDYIDSMISDLYYWQEKSDPIKNFKSQFVKLE